MLLDIISATQSIPTTRTVPMIKHSENTLITAATKPHRLAPGPL